MTDTGWMVPAIKGDQARRPLVELWGDWLHRVDVLDCAFVPSWGYGLRISCLPFSLGRKFLLSSCVRRPRLLLVVAMQPPFLVFGIQLASLFEHPAFSVGVVGWLIGGAVNLTRAIEYVVQTGRAGLLLLTAFSADRI